MSSLARFKSSPLLWITLCVTALYAAISPFAYFRHDDWIHLGNSVVFLPKDWGLLWRATQYYSPFAEEIWFFRPFVKLLVYLGFQAFGYHYELWLLFQWLLTVLATLVAARTLTLLWGDSRRTLFFAGAFFLSIHLHFGSVVWLGEGIMNCPQILCLSLALYFFVQNLLKKSWWKILVCLFWYAIALGFKESSAFIPLLFTAVAYQRGQLKEQRFQLAVIYAFAAAYLYYRLGVLPFNPAYRVKISPQHMIVPLASIISLLSLTIGTGLVVGRPRMREAWAYLPFLGLTIAPHLGHTFFSPGWLTLPGFFMIWIAASTWQFGKTRLRRIFVLFFLVSASPVFYRLITLDWFQWHRIQKEVHHFIRDLPDSKTHYAILVENCPSPQHPKVDFQRIVGAGINMEHIWILDHDRHVQVAVRPCGQMPKGRGNRLYLKWTWDKIFPIPLDDPNYP